MSKKIAIFLAPTFETIEALTVADLATRAGIEYALIAVPAPGDSQAKAPAEGAMSQGQGCRGHHAWIDSAQGVRVRCTYRLGEKEACDYIAQADALVIPGGLPAASYLAENETILEMIKKAYTEDRQVLAAICAGPLSFAAAGIIPEKSFTSYPGCLGELEPERKSDGVVVDGKVITGQGPAYSTRFALEIVKSLAGEATAKKVAEGMLYPHAL